MHVTSPGRYGGCRGEGHDNGLFEREPWIANWPLDRMLLMRTVLLGRLLTTERG